METPNRQPRILTVVQCWDDGVTSDIRLTEILRRNGAKATFNLNAGLHANGHDRGWRYKGTEVRRLGWNEMREVYRPFSIANHSLTHPHLETLSLPDAKREIEEGRDRLEQFFARTVRGFAYPFGTYNEDIKKLVRDAGHLYARTVVDVDAPFPPVDAMAFHPSCHFLSPDFWSRYDAAKHHGVFYFWGHSYELISDTMWQTFEESIGRISRDPDARWGNVTDLFLDGSDSS